MLFPFNEHGGSKNKTEKNNDLIKIQILWNIWLKELSTWFCKFK